MIQNQRSKISRYNIISNAMIGCLVYKSMPLFVYKYKGPSIKDVRQMGRGVVLKFRTFPDGGRGGGL